MEYLFNIKVDAPMGKGAEYESLFNRDFTINASSQKEAKARLTMAGYAHYWHRPIVKIKKVNKATAQSTKIDFSGEEITVTHPSGETFSYENKNLEKKYFGKKLFRKIEGEFGRLPSSKTWPKGYFLSRRTVFNLLNGNYSEATAKKICKKFNMDYQTYFLLS